MDMQNRGRAVRLLMLIAASALVLVLASQSGVSGNLLSTRAREASARLEQGYPWKGTHAPCRVQLPVTNYTVYSHFNTCPPKRVLIVGDSVGLTMGQQLSIDEQNWGTNIKNAALLGCGFVTGYEANSTGQFGDEDPHCTTEAASWVAQERQFKPQAVLVEMGWWDSQQHLIDGNIESLADPSYDAMVMQSIQNLINNLRTASRAPIFFLSVPWMSPPTWSNGHENPAVTPASHDEINALIETATHTSSTLHFVDISPYITPSGQYQQDVGGQVCRSPDGVHMFALVPGSLLRYEVTRCGRALQRGLLSLVRGTLAHG